MYSVAVHNTPVITVTTGKHEAVYAVDGSSMNPLEAFYATLAGCAAVFVKKACKEAGISPDGINISCKPFAGSGGPMTLSKFKTEIHFPDEFPADEKARVLDAVTHCAVKKIVEGGADIGFTVAEA